jgi:oligoendopeptidase F
MKSNHTAVPGPLFATSTASGQKTRDQIEERYKWRLEPVYASVGEWGIDFERVSGWLPELDSFRGRLTESASTLLKCLQTRDRIYEILGRLSVYASLKRDEDTRESKYQGMADRIRKVATTAGEKMSYFAPELIATLESTLQGYLKADANLALYRHHIDDIVRAREHTLSPREEEIIAMTADMSRAPYDAFSMLNNADLKFPTIKDEQGKEVELTHGRYYLFIESADRRVRKDTFENFFGTFEKYKNTLASTLSSQVKRTIFYARIRKYPSALHAALDGYNIPVSVFENLIATTNRNLAPLHRYMALRKRAMNLDELHVYDTNPPLVPSMEMKFEYDEATELIKNAVKPMGSDYGEIVNRALTDGWIDVHETEGKRSGAYSSCTYGTPPYILLNYNGTLDDVFTVAHELGHSMHSYLSGKTQPFVYSDYSIFVAEVASTASESLLMAHLLSQATDPRQRLYLINHWVDQIRGTFFTQVFFAEFEWMIHKAAEEGKPLTHESLSQMYGDLFTRHLGPDLISDDLNRYGWSRIPHFYYNFYVYQYATGYAAAAALSQKILDGSEGALAAYKDFLSSGSSAYPIDLLKRAGVDMTTSSPVEDTIRLFDRLVGEMEDLLELETSPAPNN